MGLAMQNEDDGVSPQRRQGRPKTPRAAAANDASSGPISMKQFCG